MNRASRCKQLAQDIFNEGGDHLPKAESAEPSAFEAASAADGMRKSSESDSSLKKMGQLLRPYWKRLSAALLFLVLLTVTNIVVPQLFALVFNRVFPEQNWVLLGMVLGGVLGLYLCRNLLYFYSKYSAVKVGESVSFHLRNRLFERLQQMSLRFYRENNPGKLSSRVMNDSSNIQQFIQDDLPALLQASLLFLGIMGTIYVMNWRLALASTIILPLHLAAFIYFRKPIKQASRSAQEDLATATGNLIEKFLGAEVVKGFSGEGREREAFRNAIDRSQRSELKGKRYHVLQKVVADLLIGLGLVCLLGYGAYQVIGGQGTASLLPGDFIAFFWYIRMLYPTISEITTGLGKLTKATASVDRAFEVLGTQQFWEEASQGQQKPNIRGRVCFENVGFQYSEDGFKLQGMDFSVEQGQVCAILGHAGAGKSTLMSLLSRFNEHATGNITVDGVDVSEIELNHLRENLGIVFQECFLFNTTIFENLRYAKPSATPQEILAITEHLGAHDFIEKLPDGYDTLVGEKGVTLSRGQKQLITLVRAMLKEPQILILDEATASIDKAHEAAVVPRILELMKGKTTFMITHEPELLKHADVVVRIDDGQLVSFGCLAEEFS